jgi:hypothetical protein
VKEKIQDFSLHKLISWKRNLKKNICNLRKQALPTKIAEKNVLFSKKFQDFFGKFTMQNILFPINYWSTSTQSFFAARK